MADGAGVVVPLPLGRSARSAPEFPEPAASFVDALDPTRALSVTWSPDHEVVQLEIQGSDGSPTELVLQADEVLDLVRTLVEGLPETGAGCPRAPATILPMRVPRRPRPAD